MAGTSLATKYSSFPRPITAGGPRRAVRGPARVPDAVRSVQRVQADHFFQVAQFAGGAADLQVIFLDDCQPRRVVAAVLQPLQAVEQHGHYTLFSDVTNYSRHMRP